MFSNSLSSFICASFRANQLLRPGFFGLDSIIRTALPPSLGLGCMGGIAAVLSENEKAALNDSRRLMAISSRAGSPRINWADFECPDSSNIDFLGLGA